MDDLVRWLGEQLDEDERIARGTGMPPDWHQGPGDDPEWTSDEMVLMWPPEFHTPYEQDKHWRGLTADPAGLAAHIAEHDPTRVLREIDAKRDLLRFAEGIHDHYETFTTGVFSRLEETLRLYALAYEDRPGYREEWRP